MSGNLARQIEQYAAKMNETVKGLLKRAESEIADNASKTDILKRTIESRDAHIKNLMKVIQETNNRLKEFEVAATAERAARAGYFHGASGREESA